MRRAASLLAAAAAVLAARPVGAPCSVREPEAGGEPVCICEDSAGNEWDMSNLGLDQGPGGSSLVTTGDCSGSSCVGDYMYHLGICENVPDMITSSGSVGSCSSSSLVGAYRVASSPGCPPSTTCQCETLAGDFSSATGTSNTPVVTAIDTDEEQGVTLEYASTSFSPTIQTKVNIICDRSASAALPAETVVDNPGTATGGYCGSSWCSAEITWRTPGICEPSGSYGWTIVILMSVCAVVYFGGGIGYGRHRNPPRDGAGALTHPQGEDAFAWHPHADTWRQLPGLVSDGWKFTQARWAQYRGLPGGDWKPVGQVLDEKLGASDEQMDEVRTVHCSTSPFARAAVALSAEPARLRCAWGRRLMLSGKGWCRPRRVRNLGGRARVRSRRARAPKRSGRRSLAQAYQPSSPLRTRKILTEVESRAKGCSSCSIGARVAPLWTCERVNSLLATLGRLSCASVMRHSCTQRPSRPWQHVRPLVTVPYVI